MLKRLYIKNVALITEADIEFDKGLNVLSGETGSGKSVILDSLNFVLGSKADKSMIRFGEQEAFVRAEFSVEENSAAAELVKGFDIDTDGEIIITRKFNSEGKGNIKINGNTVTASMLKSLTQRLVDVHGQSEHFFLLSEDNQLKVIDGIVGPDGESVKRNITSLLLHKRELKAKIADLGGNRFERERKMDMLKYAIDEIGRADLHEGEFDELKARQNVIANTERIFSAFGAVRAALSDDGGCIDILSSAIHSANGIANLDKSYEEISERLQALNADAEDISESVASLIDELTYDEREAEEIDERLSLIKGLKKKYGADEREILDYMSSAQAQYDALSDSENAIEKYSADIEATDNKIFLLCQKLTELRKSAAQGFCSGVVEELKTLNIPDAKFEVDFKPYDRKTANLNSSEGSDLICFNFSANKGEPLKPLSKVISGGEMSRFMLAIKTRLKALNDISTYVFDEIDAGISGFTALTVAEKFANIAKFTQIIAVSHLAQVCAASDKQFIIYKLEEGGKTITKIKGLNAEEKIGELVRLTGSVDSEAARQHAVELLAIFKKN